MIVTWMRRFDLVPFLVRKSWLIIFTLVSPNWTCHKIHLSHVLRSLLTKMVVKKVGPNFCGTDSFSKRAEAKWNLAAWRTNLRKREPWRRHNWGWNISSIHLWKSKYGILDVLPREWESNKTVAQMMLKRPHAYCVRVKVYASKFEHHLSEINLNADFIWQCQLHKHTVQTW